MAEADRIDNSNKACLGAGVNPITSFTQGTAESIFCNEWYELITLSELSLYKWRFATKTFDLTPNLLVDPPDTRFNVAYQIPNDVLSVDTLLVNDGGAGTTGRSRIIEYDRFQDQIHTMDTQDDTVFLKYRFRADESLWNPYFQLLVIYRLATMLSFSIARKEDIAGSMKGLADEHWKKAKTEDAQAQTNQKVNLRRLVRNRSGSLDRFWRNR
jgi:hypothetical protein